MPNIPDGKPFDGSVFRCRHCGVLFNVHNHQCPVCSLKVSSRAHAEQTGALAVAAGGMNDDLVPRGGDPKAARSLSEVKRLESLHSKLELKPASKQPKETVKSK